MKFSHIIAAVAAPLALGGTLLAAAGAASASTGSPKPASVITIHNQDEADALPGIVSKNIDIPASVTQADNVWLAWRTIQGNVTVEGYATMASDNVFGNVTVSGPGSFLKLDNQASHIHGNLVIQNSSGGYAWNSQGSGNLSFGNWTQYPGADLPGLPGTSQVDGRLDFINNTGQLWVGYPMHVSGKFTYTDNGVPFSPGMISGLTVDGQQFIS